MIAGIEEESLDDLPPNAKLIFRVLKYSDPLTQRGIVEESMLSTQTVRYALERLEGIGIVDEDVYFADARQNLYQLTDLVPQQAQAKADSGKEKACCTK